MNSSTNHPPILRRVLLAASIAVFVLIVLGGILRVTASGGACMDWPTCFGRWTLPEGHSASLDYLHRAASLLTGLLVAAAAWLAWRAKHASVWVRRGLAAALGLLLAQMLLGALVAASAMRGSPTWLSVLHLGVSLLIQASVLAAAVSAHLPESPTAGLPAPSPRRDGFLRLSAASLGLLFLLFLSGAIVANTPAAAACRAWPVCQGANLLDPGVQINLVHRSIVLISAAAAVWLVLAAWGTRRTNTAVIVSASAAGVLFFAQALLGARLGPDFPAYLLVLHQATAVAVWAALVIVNVVALQSPAAVLTVEQTDIVKVSRKGLLKDLLMLTKPIVVLLLLVTTYAGMVIGAHRWPSTALAFWTLLGGFMAAGGSGAINQFIDREDDVKMQRTQKRPIPAGRLTPGEGLAFGVAMTLASFYLMVAFVNFLAALLTLAGIIYYVLLYSLILKKTTVQNIVIGGGAGAIPPLVGWAAATGSLNIPALFLFAVVFMWTPPHFWALALVRRNDYARAGVPMLPVVRGEHETRRQILIYTLELVGLTLFLPLFGLGGSIYLIGAAALGGWLLLAAWKVWKQGGNKLAWKMYRYSSMYLAFLFVVLMVDALL